MMKKILSLRSMPRLSMANLYLLQVYSTAAACFKQVLVCYFGTYSTCRVRCIHYTVQDGLPLQRTKLVPQGKNGLILGGQPTYDV